jgi:thiol-disulfide isomerase/thioredoxin
MLVPHFVLAEGNNNIADVFFFYSEVCPHCTKQMPLMRYIDENNDTVQVHFVDIHENPVEWERFKSMYDINSGAVPRTFVGDRTFTGFIENSGPLEYNKLHRGYIGYSNLIIGAIEDLTGRKIDIPEVRKSAKVPWPILLIPLFYLVSFVFVRNSSKNEQVRRYWRGGFFAILIICTFLTVILTPEMAVRKFVERLPFPLFVLFIALVDGFNPCAFTVLIIFLSLLTYTRSRGDMTILGITFIITSSLMYFFFIILLVLTGSFFVERFGRITINILGMVIIAAGFINLKDGLLLKAGPSLKLSETQQLRIAKKVTDIVRTLKVSERNVKVFCAAIGGTVVLAIFVNIVELGCTAVLPAVYMTGLIRKFGDRIIYIHIASTLFYSIIYVFPLIAILTIFVYSFQKSRLTESQGKILKLVSGFTMLLFGFVMLVKPSLLMFG